MSHAKHFTLAIAFIFWTITGVANGATVTSDAVGSLAPDTKAARPTVRALFAAPSHLPFSFQYAGANSSTLLEKWKATVQADIRTGDHRVRTTYTYTDPDTGLVVRCALVVYDDFPAAEWVVTFKNNGPADTPILSNVNALDSVENLPGNSRYTLFHSTGSRDAADDYEPHITALDPGAVATLGVDGGRSSERDMPFYDLRSEDRGLLVGLGWPGNWSAEVRRGAGSDFHLTAGQGLTHFVLHPGEEARTPLVVMQWYRGSLVRGQNIWRRWMLEYNTPHESGKLPETMIPTGAQELETLHYNENAEIQSIDQCTSRGLPVTQWWVDAGWYQHEKSWWNVGTWDADRGQFPDGLRKVTDHTRAAGMGQILWFEPERVDTGTQLDQAHAEWLIALPNQRWKLYNLGNPAARQYLTGMIGDRIEKYGVDFYRQDFNFDPLPYWRSVDAPDRQGITENHYVSGLLDYLDDLRKRFPKLKVDCCASGGRRNDLEMLRRAVPLLQSDYRFEPLGTQGHQYGIAAWIPFHGTGGPGQYATDIVYNYRTHMCPSHGITPDYADNTLDWAVLAKLTDQERQIQPYYLGDYYPLTPYSLSDSVWLAWQYDRHDLSGGIIQAFRRPSCDDNRRTFRLLGLDPHAAYEIQDCDSAQKWRMTGADLMDTGLPIELDTKPGAALLRYDQVDSATTANDTARDRADYYVSTHGKDSNPGTAAEPFATIVRAQTAVRDELEIATPRDIAVQIAGGSYPQSQPLRFGPEDCAGGFSVTYAAAPGQKALLTGGRKVAGWKRHGNHLWTTALPDFQSGQWYFNQLFVNGKRATRARIPNTGDSSGPWKITTVKATGEGADATITVGLDHPIKAWKNLSDIEMVWLYNNDCSRKTITSIDVANQTVTLGPPVLQIPASLPGFYLIGRPEPGQTCYLENAFEFLDSPGEWYLDRSSGVLYYYPLPSEDMAKIDAVAPIVQNALVDVEGTSGKPVRNLHFKGIDVEHVDLQPAGDGYVGLFGCLQPDIEFTPAPAIRFYWIPAAVSFTHATDCSFTDGAVAHCGGIGIAALSGCARITLEGNRIYDLGGGGIVAGALRNRDFLKQAEPITTVDQTGYRFTNNYVHDCGTTYAGAAGIFTGLTQNSLIAHNEIANIAYSGIVAGGNEDPSLPFPMNNVYEYNNIHNVMQTAVDGAGIYVSCTYPAPSGPTGVIRGNWIHDLTHNPENVRGRGPWDCPGLYLDGVIPSIGVKGYEITGNVAYNTSDPPLFLLHCEANQQSWDNNSLTHDSPPQSAIDAIAAQAGLEPAYRHLLGE